MKAFVTGSRGRTTSLTKFDDPNTDDLEESDAVFIVYCNAGHRQKISSGAIASVASPQGDLAGSERS